MNLFWRDRQFLAAFIVPLLVILYIRLFGAGAFATFAGFHQSQPGRLFGLVLMWPVMEEVVFRGVLQPAISDLPWGRQRLAGVSVGNVITSLLFAASHLFTHLPYWSALVFLPSLVFGYFRERHDSLFSPLFLHVLYNFYYYLVLPV